MEIKIKYFYIYKYILIYICIWSIKSNYKNQFILSEHDNHNENHNNISNSKL